MHFFRKLMVGLCALVAVPAAAQGPISPQPAEQAATTALAADAAGAAPTPLDAADVEAWLDGFMPYALARGQVAGAIVVVVRGDGVVLEKGYGFADVAARKPVDPATTLFRPGSVSKLFTWTAVMQMVQAGKLDLDADINTYLDFKIPAYEGEPVTLRHVMTHTAGFEESIRYLISSNPKAVKSLESYVKEALPAQVFAPGTMPAYSNYATALGGYVVERVSGEPFDDYVERHIFAPLGMRYSTFRQPLPKALEPHMSKGYATVAGKPEPFELVIPGPAGSMSSSGADMGKFMMAHLNDGGVLLNADTTAMMHDYRAPGLDPLNTMALGFYEQWVNGHRAIGHGGDTGLFHSYLWLFPDADIGLYISVNSDGKDGAPGAIRSALFHEFADRYLPGEDDAAGGVEDKTAREHAQMMAGRYVSSRGAFTNFMSLLGLASQMQVSVGEDGRISVPALDGIGAGVRNWVEVEPFVWRDTATGERLAAEVKDGRVVRVSLDAISPFMMLRPAPAGTNAAWLLPALLAALGLAAIAAVGWPVRALVRRHYGAVLPLDGRARQAWRASRIFAWLVLAAVVGWMMLIQTFSNDIGSVGGPLDWLIHLLRILTPLATFGLLATSAWHLWLCVKGRQRWTMQLAALLLVIAALVLVWVTIAFNLYGFSMVY